MPDIRGSYTIHPITKVPGLWLDTDRGILGFALTSLPNRQGQETLAAYSERITTIVNNSTKAEKANLSVRVTFSSFAPLTIKSFMIWNADLPEPTFPPDLLDPRVPG